jgi:hypothetical protein
VNVAQGCKSWNDREEEVLEFVHVSWIDWKGREEENQMPAEVVSQAGPWLPFVGSRRFGAYQPCAKSKRPLEGAT